LQKLSEADPKVLAAASRADLTVYGFYVKQRTYGHHQDLIASVFQQVVDGDLVDPGSGRRIRNLCISGPPRAGKTSVISEDGAEWYAGHNRNHHIMFWTSSDPLAMHYDTNFGMTIEENRRYQYTFPGTRAWKKKGWSGEKGRYFMGTDGKDPNYSAGGMGAAVLGSGYELAIMDDPLDEKHEKSEADKKKRLEYYDETIDGRANPGAIRVVIAHRWGDADLIDHLVEGWNYAWLNIPALTTINDLDGMEGWGHLQGGTSYEEQLAPISVAAMKWPSGLTEKTVVHELGPVMAPNRHNLAELLERRGGESNRGMGPGRFDSIYNGDPSGYASARMKPEWLRHAKPDLKDFYAIATYWDLANTAGSDSDWCVGVTLGCIFTDTPGGFQRRDDYIIDIHRAKYPTESSKIAAIQEHYNIWWPGQIKGEQMSKTGGICSELQQLGVPIEPDTPQGQGDKEFRFQLPCARAGGGTLWGDHTIPWWDYFVEELAKFPAGRYDDCADALSGAVKMLQATAPVTMGAQPYAIGYTQEPSSHNWSW
jgi:predicted phage terminase large subunit-like protein